MAEYKATYKLRSTEEVFAALEDNMVTLSTMKASRFFAVFEKDITHWEKTLSLVSETIELVLTVGAYCTCQDFVNLKTAHQPSISFLTNLLLFHMQNYLQCSQNSI